MEASLSPEERYDVFGRFARSHLSTRAERLVYLALVAAPPGEPPTAQEISWERNVLLDDVVDVLGRFERAGIVGAVQVAGSPTRYRWRSDLDYLAEDGDDPFEWTDPVCGMPVRPESPYRVRGPDGQEHRFCSSLCLAAFAEGHPVWTPDRVAREVDAAQRERPHDASLTISGPPHPSRGPGWR